MTETSFKQVLFDLVGGLARRRYRMAERSFAGIGLNHTEARILTLLDGQGGSASQESLSLMITLDRTNVGRALKRLEGDGFVARLRLPSDKRTNLVTLTDTGRTTVEQIVRLRREMAEEFFSRVSEPDAATLVGILRRALPEGDSATSQEGPEA